MRRLIPLFTLLLIAPALLRAATPAQMEQARAAVYRICLRYMNNGSGYLDDASFPSSTSALETTIGSHEKEKANLAKLKAIPVPPESEYAKWDKGEFDKYWTVTFMDRTPSFDAKSACRGQVAKKVSAIKVTVAEPKPEEKPEEQKPDPAQEEKKDEPAQEISDEPASQTDAIVEAPNAQPIASDSVLTAGVDAAANQETQSRDNGNTVSIIVLCVLVLVVVALVAYALNVMRKNPQEPRQETPRQPRQAPRRQPRAAENQAVSQADLEDQSAFASYAAPQEPTSSDSRDQEIARLQAELERLRRTSAPSAPVQPESRYAPSSRPQRSAKVIYLGRANSQGVFTRADAAYNPGQSLFKLITTDSMSGTFQTIDSPEVFDLALQNPMEYLSYSCTGRNLQLSRGASAIVNEAAGTAIFDQGRWRVTRKAQIRYQ